MTNPVLSDLTVVEYSQTIMGAMCAKALCDQGANVIKIEPLGGDLLRRVGPFPQDIPDLEKSGHFLYLNAGKRGITLDLTSEKGYSTLANLLANADVFVSDLKPKESHDLGITYESVQTINPALIAAYVTYFGQTGPYIDYEGSDLIAWHMGGVGYETPGFYVTDPENEPPLRGGGKHAEYLAGWTAAAATMAALFHRKAHGSGQMVDVSAMEAVANHIRTNFSVYSYDISRLPDSRLKPNFPWIWPCKDGHVSISFVLNHWWAKLVELMGSPDWAKDGMDTIDGRRAHSELIERKVREWLLLKTRSELYELFQSRSIPCFPVQSTEEVLNTKHFRSRNFFVEQDHSIAGSLTMPGNPAKLKNTPSKQKRFAPTLGQHNDEVLSEIEKCFKTGDHFDGQKRKADGNPQPLEGVRIIDFGWILSVPHCTAWLGSLGAQVIRVESRKRLEHGRLGLLGTADGIPGLNRSAHWNGINFSKLDVTLNLSRPEAVQFIKELAAVSDVVVENFAPGVLNRLGLGYEFLRQVKPDLVMLSGSTMGLTGPESKAMGWGPNVCSYAGLPYISGYQDGPPANMGGNWPDYLVGIIMVFSVLNALKHRNLTGEGQHIDISMAEVVASAIPEAFLEFGMNGRQLKRIGNRDPNMAPHNVYPCAGVDQWVAISARDDSQWVVMRDAIGCAELTQDNRFDTLENRKRHEDELDDFIARWTKGRSPREVMETLQSAGVAAGPVMSVIEIMDDPHMRERGFAVEIDHPEVGLRTVAGLPAKFSAIPRPAYSPSPQLGQHNDLILGELIGTDANVIGKLVDDEVIF